jgi:UDP-GlcNAc:undecaprenyl-phosphate/decaprenyl-phosphate GlcNAc-1-phosphate transferase
MIAAMLALLAAGDVSPPPSLNPGASLTATTLPDDTAAIAVSIWDIFNTYAVVFAAAFLVTLCLTPLARHWALALGVVDRPDLARKQHRGPTPYFGGVAVLAGLLAAVLVSYVYQGGTTILYDLVPPTVVLGMVAIAVTGLADDIWGWDPRLKIMGQLVAAAALAVDNIGANVAAGMLAPLSHFMEPLLGNDGLRFAWTIGPLGPLGPLDCSFDLIYWVGTALIAIFVLGGCNAANLIDGLDGLLSGVVAIVAAGLLAICLLMALTPLGQGEGALTGARLVLCFALLGAVLGFLPHNFNPATIFLGDCGSLLLGYMSVTIILMLGEHGQTHLVFAGLIVFSVPIMDTALAIVRRKLSGKSMSSADDQHIHHQLKRALGGVRKAVFALYGITLLFALVGVSLAALSMVEGVRVRIIYFFALVLFSFIGVIAFKAARARQLQQEIEKAEADAASNGPTIASAKLASKPSTSSLPSVPAPVAKSTESASR